MCSVPTEETVAERARWLKELSEALNAAHRLLVSLDVRREQRMVAHELYLRIEAARLEVQSLQLSRSLGRQKQQPPEWTELLLWRRDGPELG